MPGLLDGTNSFVDVRDVCRGMILAWQKGRCGEAYILGKAGSETVIRYADVCDLGWYDPTTLHHGWTEMGSFTRGVPFAVGGGTYGVPEDPPTPLAVITWQMAIVGRLMRFAPTALFDRLAAGTGRKPRNAKL